MKDEKIKTEKLKRKTSKKMTTDTQIKKFKKLEI